MIRIQAFSGILKDKHETSIIPHFSWTRLPLRGIQTQISGELLKISDFGFFLTSPGNFAMPLQPPTSLRHTQK